MVENRVSQMTDQQFGLWAPRLRKQLEAYCAAQRGAAAVEFALIAIPFFFIIMGLLEVCLIFIMSTVIQASITDSSRQLRTGQAQSSGFTANDFRTEICSHFFGLMGCDEKLHVDVQTITDFSLADLSSPVGEGDDEFDDSGFVYDPGGREDIVLVRVFYEWDLITPMITAPLVNLGDGIHVIQVNAVFRNEPF